ncbi:MAG: hypothetical protein ABJA37_13870 [Ferruginibacter sp.]
METITFPYNFMIRFFKCNEVEYRVALSPELYGAEGGLDFTGSWHCLMIDGQKGTRHLLVTPDEAVGLTLENGTTLEWPLMFELSKIIKELRQNLNLNN